MRITVIFILLLQWLFMDQAIAEDKYQTAIVATPYIELHTGPGAKYPVFHVIERGKSVEIIKRRTDWFKVRSTKGTQGWVSMAQMEQTLTASGQPMQFRHFGRSDFEKRKWEVGVLAGDFSGARVMSMYGNYAITSNLSAELTASQVLGNSSDSILLNADLLAQPFPEWRISPFFALGTGVIDTNPHATLVQTQDRTDIIGHVGIGARMYVARKFLLRIEYKHHVIFTSRNDNQEINEWKAGFAIFY